MAVLESILKSKMREVKLYKRKYGDKDYAKGALDGLKYALKQSRKIKTKVG